MVDGELLVWINQGWSHPWLDFYFNLVSEKEGFSFPLLALMMLALGLAYGAAGWRAALALLLLVGLGDFTGSLLKEWFAMPRPCLEWAEHLRRWDGSAFVACGESRSGMPSNHALNFFSTLVFMSLLLRRWYWTALFLLLAVSVAISRVYLGSHFPSQVLVGAVFGAVFGALYVYVCMSRFDFFQQILHQRAKR